MNTRAWVLGRQILRRVFGVFAVAVATSAIFASGAFASGGLPRGWDPHTVAVNDEPGNTFLLRPGQIIAGPGDAPDVAAGADRLARERAAARSA